MTRRTLIAFAFVSIGLIDGAAQTRTDNAAQIRITVLSSRPDMVSGGDALVAVALPAGVMADAVSIRANGQDVRQAFRADASGRTLTGLVGRLIEGKNVIDARAGARTARLELVNFPITGPIVSGPHLTPFVCNTAESGLGAPLDDNCSAATRVDYFYRSTTPSAVTPAQAQAAAAAGLAPSTGQFKPLTDTTGPKPADLATTTTSDGRTVPYIVRVESGTINRAIYRIAVLDDPSEAPPTRSWRPGAGWNGKLMVSFGGGCGTNYTQGTNQATGALSDAALSRGFAHAISTQNVMQQHCNDHLSGEALMMIKEHFIEQYGVPKWTLGFGGSGGAIQQLLIGQNFPGLIDGLLPSLTYPDSTSVRQGVTDCRLLMKYFAAHPDQWTPAKRTAVEGYTPGTCTAWDRAFVDVIVATARCGNIPPSLVYHPVNNPKGARCTIWDTNVNSYGRDPVTGFGRRSLDNTGVQYGLRALNEGVITTAEFLDLNRSVGGFDNDGNVRAERTVADPESLRLAYETGRVNIGAGGLGSVPILHFRSYNDPVGDIHDRFRDFSVRERLRKANGRTDNQVIWIYPRGAAGGGVSGLAIDTMSQWLDRLSQDTAPGSKIDKIVRTKPAAAADACWDANGARIDEPATFDGPGRCNTLYPNHLSPRLAAGATVADDVLKCQLKPIDWKDYKVTFSAEERQALSQIFAGGVCDYAKPGVNQKPLRGTFLTLPLTSATTTTSAR